MLKLLRNDIRANSLSLMFMFVLLNGTFILIILVRLGLQNLLLAGLWLALITPLPILLRSEQYKSSNLYRSLPIRLSSIVWAKYASVLVVALATIIYTLAYAYIIDLEPNSLHYSIEAGYAYPHTFIARGIFYALVMLIGVPLIFAAGSLLRIVWGMIVVLFLRKFAIAYLLEFSLHSSFTIGINAWVSFVIVVSILLLFLSQEVSVWILHQRD